MTRAALPNRRAHITQKVKIGKDRTLYLSVDSETAPNEIFLRIKGDTDAEKVVAYDIIARLISLAVQSGITLEAVGKVLYGTQDGTRGPVRGDDRLKFCGGTLDYIGQHLLLYYAGWNDLAPRPTPGGTHEQEKDTSTGHGSETRGAGDRGSATTTIKPLCDDPSRPDDPAD